MKKRDECVFNILKTCRHGLMVYNRNDAYIGRSLDLYGEFSQGETELFQQVVGIGDVVIEVGANIGAHTLRLAQLAGPGGAFTRSSRSVRSSRRSARTSP